MTLFKFASCSFPFFSPRSARGHSSALSSALSNLGQVHTLTLANNDPYLAPKSAPLDLIALAGGALGPERAEDAKFGPDRRPSGTTSGRTFRRLSSSLPGHCAGPNCVVPADNWPIVWPEFRAWGHLGLARLSCDRLRAVAQLRRVPVGRPAGQLERVKSSRVECRNKWPLVATCLRFARRACNLIKACAAQASSHLAGGSAGQGSCR